MDKMNINEVIKKAGSIRKELLKNDKLSKDIDSNINTIPVHKVGTEEIKLIFLGQDPTVKNEKSRRKIKTVLNLDRPNSLYTYLSDITTKLGYDIEKNVYATNFFKCFFKFPPAREKGLLSKHKDTWLDLLIQELKEYPDTVIITLGEPLIDVIVLNGSKKVRDYWGYIGKNMSSGIFSYIKAADNIINRDIYPFPHQPSIRKEFYRKYLGSYIDFVKSCN